MKLTLSVLGVRDGKNESQTNNHPMPRGATHSTSLKTLKFAKKKMRMLIGKFKLMDTIKREVLLVELFNFSIEVDFLVEPAVVAERLLGG